MLSSLTSYEQAINSLGVDTKWSCSFGNPGEGGYVEYRRDQAGKRYAVSNGDYMAQRPFTWTAQTA
jgi:hypothetical protein